MSNETLSNAIQTGDLKAVIDHYGFSERGQKKTEETTAKVPAQKVSKLVKRSRLLRAKVKKLSAKRRRLMINLPIVIESKVTTALHLAMQYKQPEIIDWLLKRGADPDAPDGNGKTPMLIATLAHNDVLCSKLYGKKTTALHMAVRLNKPGVVNMLLADGANLNARDENDDTPLHIAASMGDEKLLDILVNADAKTDIVNKDGYTAKDYYDSRFTEETFSELYARTENSLAKDGLETTAKRYRQREAFWKAIEAGDLQKVMDKITENEQAYKNQRAVDAAVKIKIPAEGDFKAGLKPKLVEVLGLVLDEYNLFIADILVENLPDWLRTIDNIEIEGYSEKNRIVNNWALREEYDAVMLLNKRFMKVRKRLKDKKTPRLPELVEEEKVLRENIDARTKAFMAEQKKQPDLLEQERFDVVRNTFVHKICYAIEHPDVFKQEDLADAFATSLHEHIQTRYEVQRSSTFQDLVRTPNKAGILPLAFLEAERGKREGLPEAGKYAVMIDFLKDKNHAHFFENEVGVKPEVETDSVVAQQPSPVLFSKKKRQRPAKSVGFGGKAGEVRIQVEGEPVEIVPADKVPMKPSKKKL